MPDPLLEKSKMHLVDALMLFCKDTSSLRHRINLATQLERLGCPSSRDVWLASTRIAAARGAFFVALTLCRRRLHAADQRAALAELADRFGEVRWRGGRPLPPPVPTPYKLEIPDTHDEVVELSCKLGCDISSALPPEDVQAPDIPIFGSLPQSEFVALASALEPVPLDADQSIIKQGEIDRSVFLLALGRARVVQTRDDPFPVTLAEIRAPAIIGEMALLTSVPRRASVVANEPSLAWRIDAAMLTRLELGHPDLARELAGYAKRRLIENVMKSCAALSGLGTGGDLMKAFHLRNVMAGGQIFPQGAPPPGLFVVLHGEVEVWAEADDGERVRVAVLSEGDLLGEMSLLTGDPTTASARMPAGGVLLHLSSPDYRRLRSDLPDLELGLTELMEIRRGSLNDLVNAVDSEFDEIRDIWVID